jgi:ParB family chromosome partitioning protein
MNLAELRLKELQVGKIAPSPFQPREAFDKESLEELAQSLRTTGLLQPILVRPNNGGFQIAAGERRWRAAQIAGLKQISSLVRPMDDETLQLYSIVENLHRVDLKSAEQEKAIHDLYKKYYEPSGKTRADMANDTGLSPTRVSSLIRSYEEREGVAEDEEEVAKSVSTKDLETTRGIAEPVRKELLTRKARGEIGGKDLEQIAQIVREVPEQKQRKIAEKATKEVLRIREQVAEVRAAAPRSPKKPGKPEENGPSLSDQKHLKRILDAAKDVRMIDVGYVNGIKDDVTRWKAVELLEKTREHCDRVLRSIEKQKWYREG